MDCEIILPSKIALRGRAILEAMIAAAPGAGVTCLVTDHWKRRSRVLMSYGLGHPLRRVWTQEHLRRGGRLIGWDLGYWDRDSAMRLTLDQDHPQKHISDMPPDRWESTGFKLRNDYSPAGPIILCGLGLKQRELIRAKGQSWEIGMLARIRATYPKKQILYRPKKPECLPGCPSLSGAIEDVLKNASLVVCAHSNVAVDACIAGIPVVCWDGAAAALYGPDLSNPRMPDENERLRFLRNLAWWQWKPTEAASAWEFLKRRL